MAHERHGDTIQRARDQRKNPTPAEQRLWSELRGRKLNGKKFRRQHVIGGYIVDFFCADCGLVIEVDGQHHDEADARWSDALRTKQLERRGLRILRVSNGDVMQDLSKVLRQITNSIS